MQINVTPQVDGASPIFGEQQVNTYETNEQHVPVTVGLQGPNNGGYVVVWRSTPRTATATASTASATTPRAPPSVPSSR
jgi:hypothetical protein